MRGLRRSILGSVAILVATGALWGQASADVAPAASGSVVWDDTLRAHRLASLIAALNELEHGGTVIAPPSAPRPVPADATALAFRWPVRDARDVTSAFGWRLDPIGGAAQFHHGLDIRCSHGEPIRAVRAGVISDTSSSRTYGPTITVDHDYRLQSTYGHLSAITVSEGERVTGGQIIGRCGASGRATGPHLHLVMLHRGSAMDPYPFLMN